MQAFLRFPGSVYPTMASVTLFLLCLFLPGLLGAGDLYIDADDVEILNSKNFKEIVENSTSAWLVEFYASWCGYCQRFAPSWKKFATEAAPWRDLVRVGVLDCSEEDNSETCGQLGIVKYPTVRYFHEGYTFNENKAGEEVPHSSSVTVQELKGKIFERLITEIRQDRGKMYPNLLPYNNPTIDDIFTTEPKDIEFVFVILEQDAGYLGIEIALDIHKTPNISIRYSLHNNSALSESLNVSQKPALIILDKNNNSRTVIDALGTKEEVVKLMAKFLEDKGRKIIQEIPEKIQRGSGNNTDPNYRSLLILRNHIRRMGDVVFQSDLEAALRYSLLQEVGTVQKIEGERLEALNKYLKVLKKYFPFGYKNPEFIDDLVNVTSGSFVEGVEIQRIVKEGEANKAFSSDKMRFLGCLGSSRRYRGYPCSLWRLFHYLTVASYDYNTNNKKANPLEVLGAMHGYVKNFFSCVHCSEHFQKMASERQIEKVDSLKNAILWLWEAHNVVNKRLRGDETEDPDYPKDEFPSKIRCKECYVEEGWDRERVFRYLLDMYGRYNVRYVGVDTRVLFPGLD